MALPVILGAAVLGATGYAFIKPQVTYWGELAYQTLVGNDPVITPLQQTPIAPRSQAELQSGWTPEDIYIHGSLTHQANVNVISNNAAGVTDGMIPEANDMSDNTVLILAGLGIAGLVLISRR